MTFQVEYVFWDCDNTLVNTAAHHWQKHVEVLKRYNITLPDTYRQRVYENNGAQNWVWMSETLGLTVPQAEYLAQVDEWYKAHIQAVEIRDGVSEALKFFKARNMPQAVVSNARKTSVMAVLEAKKLLPYFDFVLCREDYARRKPDPDPYVTALRRMEAAQQEVIDPQLCLVIEDDPLGVQAGEAAGMVVLHRPIGDKKSIKSLVG